MSTGWADILANDPTACSDILTDDELKAWRTPALDALMADDHAWFRAHPARRYRLRRTTMTELLPGETMRPGEHTLVVLLTHPARGPACLPIRLVRLPKRLLPSNPQVRARVDTETWCRMMLEQLDTAGMQIGSMPLLAAIKSLNE